MLLNEDCIALVKSLVMAERNILLTGGHGVGKTTMIMDVLTRAKKAPIKYYSCATLDPWVDLVGIPIPDNDRFYHPQQKKAINARLKKDPTLMYCRPKDLLEAKVMVCDEINRSHPKVQNALLEAIQFKTINGQPLPNLVMVVAMQNPATKLYQVTELDPALVDRFHGRIMIEGCPSVEYYETKGIDTNVAQALVDWWNDDLTDETRPMVTPRTMEYIGLLVKDKISWKAALGDSLGVPVFHLENRFQQGCGLSKYQNVTLAHVLEDLDTYADLSSTDRDFATHITKVIEDSKPIKCWDAAEVIAGLPDEFQMRLMTNRTWAKKLAAEYPKLHHSFHECPEVQKVKVMLDEALGDN